MALKTRPGGPSARPGARWNPRWFTQLDHLILLSGVAVVLSLSYLLYLILTGGLSYTLIAGTQLETISNSFSLTARVFLWSLWLLILLALGRHYRVESVGLLTAGAGAVCYFGMFYLVNQYSSATAARDLQALGGQLITSFRATGTALMVIGLLRFVVGRIVMMTYHPPAAAYSRVPGIAYGELTAPEVRVAGRHSVMRKCWELHFCRGSVRTTCPRFVEGIACWRRRSGCYCDQDLAGRLLSQVTGAGGSARMQMAEELATQQHRAQDLYRQAVQKRNSKAARKMCRECPIYNEHEKFKYRALSWLAYPAAVAIGALLSQAVRDVYQRSDAWVASYLSKYTVIPHELTDKPIQGWQWLSAENIAVVIVGVLVLALMLQLTEMAVFRLKL